MARNRHRFRRYGKAFQLRIENGADLGNVLSLDESLWVATSAPVSAFRCDGRFLELMDADGSGRISSEEVKRAVRWLLDRLADPLQVASGADEIAIAAVRADTERTEGLLRAARHILRLGGRPDEERISLPAVSRFRATALQQPLNGDGIIVTESARDPATAAFIGDVLACTGGEPDAGGGRGVSGPQIAAFQQGVSEFLAWRRRAEDGESETGRSNIMPFGAETPAVYEVYAKVRDRVRHYFALCHFVRFEPGALERIGCGAKGLSVPEAVSEDALRVCLETRPLAVPDPEALLPLKGARINPLHRDALAALTASVLTRVLGGNPETLSEAEWEQVERTFAPYAAYLADKRGALVEGLSREKLETYSSGEAAEEARSLIAADREAGAMLQGVEDLERLLLYHKHLCRFVNNFVNFSQLYDTRTQALFEEGAAVIDGRWFNFAVRVQDIAAHQVLARTSNLFILYLEIQGHGAAPACTVAVPATSGTRGNLCVGKRGVFFDSEGRQRDARVVQIIENPISLREALIAPFTRLWGFVVGKIEAMSSSSEQELHKSAENALTVPPAAPAGEGNRSLLAGSPGLLLGLSVSVAAVGSAFAFITKTMAGLSPLQRGLGLAAAALTVGVPVTLVAVLKLRSQDLSALLEGCGWAVNARMRPNRAQRRWFTRRAAFPPEAMGVPRFPWLRPLALVLLLLLLLTLLSRIRMPWAAPAGS